MSAVPVEPIEVGGTCRRQAGMARELPCDSATFYGRLANGTSGLGVVSRPAVRALMRTISSDEPFRARNGAWLVPSKSARCLRETRASPGGHS